MEYVQMTLSDWLSIKNELEEELRGAAAGFVRIGYLLRKIDETEGYKQDGYDTLTEWAEKNYGLSGSAVSRFMAINRKYSIGGYSKQLQIEYAKYGQAKLAEMLTLPDEALPMVSPEMKREDIREIKAFERQAPKEEPVQEEEESDLGSCPQWIAEFLNANPIDLERRAFKERSLSAMIEEVNPTGAKTFRYKRTMVSMFSDRIMVRVFPAAAEKMEWQEFFDMALTEAERRQRAVTEPVIEQEEYKESVIDIVEEPETEEEPESDPVPDEVRPIEPASEFAPAQKSPSPIVSNNVKTDSAIAEEPAHEVEQVEIDEILPKPIEADQLRDLKDRFLSELNSLRILVDTENFESMEQNIKRLEHLRLRLVEERDGIRNL